MKKLLVTFCLVLASACTQTPSPSIDDLIRITDKDQLKDLIQTTYPGPIDEKATGTDSNAPQAASQTNTQVSGIDEGDIVKTNGRFIATVTNGEVILIDTETESIIWRNDYKQPAPKEGEATVNVTPSEIFLTETTLMVFGNKSSYGGIIPMTDAGPAMERFAYWPWYGGDTFIELYQLNGNRAPSLIRSLLLKGSYTTSRLTQDELILVSTQNNLIIYDEKNNPIIQEPTVTDRLNNVVVSSIESKTAYAMPGHTGNSFVNVMKLDLKGYREPDLSSYLGFVQAVYMNAEDLILAQNRWLTDSQGNGNTVTDFLRFDVRSLSLQAKGSAIGYLLNQFSMDMDDGIFRAALTEWIPEGKSVNRVAVYDGSFNKLSSVENLAEGETIRSVRFVGNKAYVVTFRNVDPLFVIDLSNPKGIRLVGELKVPGFSTYLHPLNADVLFGIAEDLKVNEEVIEGKTFVSIERLGIKISLFSVADPAKPVELASLNIISPNGSTEASYNHKALVYDPDKHLLYLPYSNTVATDPCSGPGYCVQTQESGIKVVEVTPTSLKLVKTLAWPQSDTNRWISRSVYVGDKLYLISNLGIMVYDRADYRYLHTLEY